MNTSDGILYFMKNNGTASIVQVGYHTFTGDITGSGNGAITTTLATVNANVGTFNGITVNAKGLVTGAASITTTVGDLIVGGTGGTPTRLAAGTNGQVLTMVSGSPAWATASGGGGFTNPMTTAGDLIIGGASGAAARLGIGTSGQVLSVVSGSPAWVSGGSYTPSAVAITGGTIDGTAIGLTTPSTGSFTSVLGGTTTNGLVMQAFTGVGGYGAIYNSSVTPSNINFALASSGAITVVNGTSSVGIDISNVNIFNVTSTGVTSNAATFGAMTGGTAANGLIIQSFTGLGGYGAIYNSTVTPSGTNYALVSSGAITILNSTSSVGLDISNVNILNATSTGIAITGTLTANGITTITNSTGSSSSATGALVVSGGLGVAGAVFGAQGAQGSPGFGFSGTASAGFYGATGVVGVSAAALKLFPGTATIAPLIYQTGVNLTTAVSGAQEYDGFAFYGTTNATTPIRGVMGSEQVVVLAAAYTLTSQTAAQKLFNSTTNGTVTLPVGTYQFECMYSLTSMSTTSGSFGFALGGTFAGSQMWQARAVVAAATTATSEQSTVNTAANTTLATAGTAGAGRAFIRGIIRVTTAGTAIPQVSLTVAAAAVVGVNSYFKVSAVGNGTVATVGNWS